MIPAARFPEMEEGYQNLSAEELIQRVQETAAKLAAGENEAETLARAIEGAGKISRMALRDPELKPATQERLLMLQQELDQKGFGNLVVAYRLAHFLDLLIENH